MSTVELRRFYPRTIRIRRERKDDVFWSKSVLHGSINPTASLSFSPRRLTPTKASISIGTMVFGTNMKTFMALRTVIRADFRHKNQKLKLRVTALPEEIAYSRICSSEEVTCIVCSSGERSCEIVVFALVSVRTAKCCLHKFWSSHVCPCCNCTTRRSIAELAPADCITDSHPQNFVSALDVTQTLKLLA